MLSLVLLYSYRDSDETNVAFLAAVRGGPLCEGGSIWTWLYIRTHANVSSSGGKRVDV
jgi:hypothetical protein